MRGIKVGNYIVDPITNQFKKRDRDAENEGMYLRVGNYAVSKSNLRKAYKIVRIISADRIQVMNEDGQLIILCKHLHYGWHYEGEYFRISPKPF